MRYFGFGVTRRLIYTRYLDAKGVVLYLRYKWMLNCQQKAKKMVEKETLRILSNALRLVHRLLRFFVVHAKFAAVLISTGNAR